MTADPPVLQATSVEVRYGTTAAVAGVDLRIRPGTVTAVVGPNGCGKSTLLRALGRLLTPDAGAVLLDGHDIARLPTREVARRIGVLPQSPVAPDGVTVADLVSRGRDPHRRWYDQWSRSDEDVVTDALRRTGMLDLAHRPVDALSGGQRQRAWIAMALAQDTSLLLLDEPTTFLDVVHQLDVLDLVAELNRTRGTTVVMVLHDLSMAARFADRLVALRSGTVVADGPPEAVVTPQVLADVFDLDCDVQVEPRSGRPHVVPLGRSGRRSNLTSQHG